VRNLSSIETRSWARGRADVIGAPVLDVAGRRTGELDDIVVDARTGLVCYAVLALGAGETRRLYAVPWRLLTPVASGHGFSLPLTARRLQGAPSFAADAWPDFGDRRALAVVHAYFGVPPDTA
jgi:sporulation protein YlmC with PRC-barrel domain